MPAFPPAPPWTSARLFWSLQVAGWSAYGGALMLPWIGRYSVASMLPNKVVVAGAGLLVTSLLRQLYLAVVRRDASLPSLLAIAVAASLAGAAAWTGVASSLLGVPLGRDVLAMGALERPIPQFAGLVYHAMVLACWSVLYIGVRHHRDLVRERERSLRAECLAREARLEALARQIGPHFLFNALNAISTLVATGRAAEATATIARLGDLLRSSLDAPVGGVIPLADEIELVGRYLAIEQVRFGDRLEVRIDVDDDALDAEVPAMILQPIVENAVRHGVARREGRSRVLIEASRGSASVVVSVHDDGEGGASVHAGSGMGIGLANTRERLRELYGDAHRLELRAHPGGGFSATIELPAPARAVARRSARVLEAAGVS